MIFAELAAGYRTAEELDAAHGPDRFLREELRWDAAFLAGKAFLSYRRVGGTRTAPLPDVLVGAHATVRGYGLLTRDRASCSRSFPTIDIPSPDGSA